MYVKWSQFGSPAVPGTYPLPGQAIKSEVMVGQEHIDFVQKYGGDPYVELQGGTAAGASDLKQYSIFRFGRDLTVQRFGSYSSLNAPKGQTDFIFRMDMDDTPYRVLAVDSEALELLQRGDDPMVELIDQTSMSSLMREYVVRHA